MRGRWKVRRVIKGKEEIEEKKKKRGVEKEKKREEEKENKREEGLELMGGEELWSGRRKDERRSGREKQID